MKYPTLSLLTAILIGAFVYVDAAIPDAAPPPAKPPVSAGPKPDMPQGPPAAVTVLPAQSPRPASTPADKPEDVVFWAHHMLSVGHGALGTSPNSGGNVLAWPFAIQHEKTVDDYKQDILQALDSGINGLQLWGSGNSPGVDNFFQAADEVYRETGQTMYIAPLWLQVDVDPATGDSSFPGSAFPKWRSPGRMDIGYDPVTSAKAIVAFAKKYQGNRHFYTHHGKPVQFLWLARAVYGSDPSSDSFKDAERRQQAILDEVKRLTGDDLLVIPEAVSVDKRVLGRTDIMRKSWNETEVANTPESTWLQDVGWQGAAGWDRAWYLPAARKFQQRLSQHPEFLWIPGIAAGYDSSNRIGSFTYIPYRGLLNLLDSLNFWVRDNGYKQIYYSTWNDPQETLLIPSSRNVWGDNTILRFFHGIAVDGKSPFDSDKVVVSYMLDCQYGELLDIQILGLPARDRGIALRATVDLASQGATQTLHGQTAPTEPNRESLLSLRWDSTDAFAQIDYVQPRVTIEARDVASGQWKPLYTNLLLPPVRLRHNFIQFPARYAAELSRIAPGEDLALRINTEGTLDQAIVQAGLPSPIRRLVLSDGSMSLGAFRQPGTEPGADGYRMKNVFLKVESSLNAAPSQLNLSVKDGWIHDLYMTNGNLGKAMTPVNGTEVVFNDKVARRHFRVARCDLNPDSLVTLGLSGPGENPSVSATVKELTQGPATKTFRVNGKLVNLNVRLTTDATDPLVDYPLPAEGTFERELPLFVEEEGVRVLYATALLESGQVAYSPAVLLTGKNPAGTEPVQVRYLRTGGAYDDFTKNQLWTQDCEQPYTADQIMEAGLPRNRIPYYYLGFEEGAGSRLSDRGTSQQPGRAWIDSSKSAPRDEHYAIENAGTFRWLDQGWKGKALHLGKDAAIWFRTKAQPLGAETISLWVKVGRPPAEAAAQTASVLRAGPFEIRLSPSGQATVEFHKSGTETQFQVQPSFKDGWNQIAFIYDLTSVRCYINGALAGYADGMQPVLQRMGRLPLIRFEKFTNNGKGFSGDIDEVQYVGADLGPEEIAKLYRGERFR